MGISIDEIDTLESILNNRFLDDRLAFRMSYHFVRDRMNDPRNSPVISIAELHSIFNRFTTKYFTDLMNLRNLATFNIRCSITHINIPCAVTLTQDVSGLDSREIMAITVMRKQNFKAKDSLEFVV